MTLRIAFALFAEFFFDLKWHDMCTTRKVACEAFQTWAFFILLPSEAISGKSHAGICWGLSSEAPHPKQQREHGASYDLWVQQVLGPYWRPATRIGSGVTELLLLE